MNVRPLRRSRQAGFTLVEMLVALVIGALVVAAMFSIGGASARHFQEQQRIGVTQRAVRNAMARLRRDIARAGYMSVPHNLAPSIRTCPTPTIPMNVPAVWFADNDREGNTALGTTRALNGVHADRLRLLGNYDSDDGYLVRGLSGAGDRVELQMDWLAFRRNFVTVDGSGSTAPNVDRFENQVFRPGNMLHIMTRSGVHFFVQITGASLSNSRAVVSIRPSIPLDNPCLEGLGGGAFAAPLSWIEYAMTVPSSTSTLRPTNDAVTGTNTMLVRRQLDVRDPSGGTMLVNSERVVLEYAVNFDLSWVVDSNLTPGAPARLSVVTGTSAQTMVQTTPWMVRSAVVDVAARTPEQDIRFPWPDAWSSGRPNTAPLNRYRVFNDRRGAARVRSLTTEINIPNQLQ